MNQTSMPKRRYVEIAVAALLGLVVCLMFVPVQSRPPGRRVYCRNNLKVIGLALYTYHDTWGSFPPAFTNDDKGRPIHSWRTLILQYLDQAPLYKEYRFDEPWDGPHNVEFRDREIPNYVCPSDSTHKNGSTNYVAVVGANTAWPGPRSANLKTDFPDGTANTILVVEVENSGIDWIEPRDLTFDDMSWALNDPAGRSISAPHIKEGPWWWSESVKCVNVLFADGSVKSLPVNTAPETIRTLVTASGAEKVHLEP